MEMVMLVMMFRTKMMQMTMQHFRVVIEKEPVVHLHHHRRYRRRHTVMIGTIVSSQILLLLATPSSSICMPDFLESAIQVSCTYARQLQLNPFLLGTNRCKPTRDCHNCAPPWLHLLHGATPKDYARLYTIAP